MTENLRIVYKRKSGTDEDLSDALLALLKAMGWQWWSRRTDLTTGEESLVFEYNRQWVSRPETEVVPLRGIEKILKATPGDHDHTGLLSAQVGTREWIRQGGHSFGFVAYDVLLHRVQNITDDIEIETRVIKWHIPQDKPAPSHNCIGPPPPLILPNAKMVDTTTYVPDTTDEERGGKT